MSSAAFLLIINFSIGLSFACAFLAVTWRSGVRLGRWCAAGFVAAAATVAVEAFAFLIPSTRLVSALSFSLLMVSLTAITAGLLTHYRPGARLGPLAAVLVAAVAFNILVVFDLPRGTLAHALGYQMPFALLLATACGVVLMDTKRRAVDLALATVLALCAFQFVVKTVMEAHAGSGPGVRDYIASAYAHYSQTAGGVLSLLLGLSLLGVVVSDVMAEAARRLQRDVLSGALNRAAFLDQARMTLKGMRRISTPCLIMCDLDHFKSINDRFGHAAGDEVIRAFGSVLLDLAGEAGLCGRIGGEEFCVLLPHSSIANAQSYVERVRSSARMLRYVLVSSDVAVTASFGIAMVGQAEPLESAMRWADMALYEAKAAGRDCYTFASLATEPGGRMPLASSWQGG